MDISITDFLPKINLKNPFSKNDSNEADDFISRPGQGVQKFSSDDTLIGVKGKLVDMAPLNDSQNKTNQLLEENNRLMKA